VDAIRIPYVHIPTGEGDTLVGMSLLVCMQQAQEFVAVPTV
jgi:hypothetical protein